MSKTKTNPSTKTVSEPKTEQKKVASKKVPTKTVAKKVPTKTVPSKKVATKKVAGKGVFVKKIYSKKVVDESGKETTKKSFKNIDGVEEEVQKRSFKVKLDANTPAYGRFSGVSPYQAANKALSGINKKKAEDGEDPEQEITFYLIESTLYSKKNVHQYRGRRIKLDEPVEYTVGDTTITKYFKNALKKIKKDEQVPLAPKVTKKSAKKAAKEQAIKDAKAAKKADRLAGIKPVKTGKKVVGKKVVGKKTVAKKVAPKKVVDKKPVAKKVTGKKVVTKKKVKAPVE